MDDRSADAVRDRRRGTAGAHRRYILLEACVAGLLSGLLSLIMFAVVFSGMAELPAHSAKLIFDSVPQSFMTVLMSGLVPTLLTRKRVRSGAVAPAAAALPWRVPRSAVIRALLAAVLVTCVAVPLTAAILSMSPAQVSFGAVLVVKTTYGTVLGTLVSAAATWLALHDRTISRSTE